MNHVIAQGMPGSIIRFFQESPEVGVALLGQSIKTYEAFRPHAKVGERDPEHCRLVRRQVGGALVKFTSRIWVPMHFPHDLDRRVALQQLGISYETARITYVEAEYIWSATKIGFVVSNPADAVQTLIDAIEHVYQFMKAKEWLV